MFAVNVRRCLYICDKVFVRNLRSRNPGSALSNPGLEKRLKAFRQDGIKIQNDDVEEFIEQSDSSFYEVGDAYNEHLNETLIGKHELRHHIVKERYFKENMPNLLTWSEKEQIRHLATTQPDEWTPERIAESFPVTEQVVKKLLKYPWKPATEERIARHDASAMRNWRELKEGTLDIPEELRQHFLKFSERTIPPLNRKQVKIDVSQEKMGEFEQIVRRCANNNSNKNNNKEMGEDKINNSEARTSQEKVDYSKVTLNELASKIKKRLDEGQNVDMPDRLLMDTVDMDVKDKYNITIPKDEINAISEIKEEKSLAQATIDEKTFLGINYPERIRIPKQAHKKGATYKVNDCYYDHDGRFLYRVIGMDENANSNQ